MLVYIPEDIAAEGKDFLTANGIDYYLGTGTDADTLKKEIQDADGIIVRTAKLTRDVLECGRKLKIIARHGAGVDNIDLDYAKEHGIVVTNGPESNTNAVAEHIAAYVLGCAYMMPQLDDAVRAGDWGIRGRIRLTEIAGKTIGFIGFGKIGRSAALKLHDGFGMNIIAWSRHLKEAEVPDYVTVMDTMEDVLRESDFVSLCCPANAANADMISARELQMMKKTAYLINCARGQLVDEHALAAALKDGTIRGAAIDCTKKEPIEKDHPFHTLTNIIMSPHCSSHTPESFGRMALHAAMGIEEYVHGKLYTWRVV